MKHDLKDALMKVIIMWIVWIASTVAHIGEWWGLAVATVLIIADCALLDKYKEM